MSEIFRYGIGQFGRNVLGWAIRHGPAGFPETFYRHIRVRIGARYTRKQQAIALRSNRIGAPEGTCGSMRHKEVPAAVNHRRCRLKKRKNAVLFQFHSWRAADERIELRGSLAGALVTAEIIAVSDSRAQAAEARHHAVAG